MSDPIEFPQANFKFKAPAGMGPEECGDLHVFRRWRGLEHPVITSCWQLTPDELQELQRNGGKIFLTVLGVTIQPVRIEVFTPVEMPLAPKGLGPGMYLYVRIRRSVRVPEGTTAKYVEVEQMFHQDVLQDFQRGTSIADMVLATVRVMQRAIDDLPLHEEQEPVWRGSLEVGWQEVQEKRFIGPLYRLIPGGEPWADHVEKRNFLTFIDEAVGLSMADLYTAKEGR